MARGPAPRGPPQTCRDHPVNMTRLIATAAAVLAPLLPPDAAAQPSGGGAPGAGVVQVETLELEPTVVKTGDRITQRYRLRFPDLIPSGREIIVLEDRMTPEALPVHPFEAVSLAVEKDRIDDTHVWDFVYGFRLVDPNKMTYVLPSFSFYYLVRDLGEDIEDAEVQQVDGGQGLVRYVTSITDEPLLDIRDTIELGTFDGLAAFFRTLAWVVAPLPLALWLVMLVRFARKPKAVSMEKQQEEDELARIEAQIPAPPSIWEARRVVARELGALRRLPRDAAADQLADRQRSLVLALRDYLRADLPGLHPGDTALDIQRHVDGLKDGYRKGALGVLAARLVAYQRGLETGKPAPVERPAAEARQLGDALSLLRPHVRMLNNLKALVGAASPRPAKG